LEEKLALVERYCGEYGLNGVFVLFPRPIHLPSSSAAQGGNKEPEAKVLRVMEDHPAYGYPRIQVELAVRYGERVNQKRFRRLLSGWELALRCWEMAKADLATWSLKPRGLIVHHNHDLVYTSYCWLRQLLMVDKAVVSYCEGGTKDNPWIEAFWGRFKRENMSLFLDAATFEEPEWVIGRQMSYYNKEGRHLRLGYRSPMEYLINEGFIPKTLAENDLESGSVSGAQAQQ